MANHASASATMPSDSTKPTTTTTTSNPRIGTIEQPHSRLHALPPELRDMIYAYVVVSPDDHYRVVNIAAIPMRAPAVAPSSSSSSSSSYTAQGFGRGRGGRGITKKPLPKPQPQQRQTHLYLLYQPPLACTDRSTRAEVLRIFFTRNTFLFRITPSVLKPLRTWLDATAPPRGGKVDGSAYDYAGGAARLIERVAIERDVPTACAVQRIEDRSEMGGEVHTWRVVVGVEEMRKKGRKEGEGKKKNEGEEEHQPQPQLQLQPPSSSSSSSTPTRPTLTIHHEADLAPTCACTLRAAAALSPHPGRVGFGPPRYPPRAAEVLAFACDVEDQVFRDLAGDCSLGGLCNNDDAGRVVTTTQRARRACGVCGGNVSRGLFGIGVGSGVGERLMPWYEMVAMEEGRL